jgi:hypothetical protein
MDRSRSDLIDRLERRDEIVRKRECRRRLHANAARHLRDKIIAIVGEDVPGVTGGTDVGNGELQPVELGRGEPMAEATRNLTTEGVLFRHCRRVHRDEMTEHHAGHVAGRMDVGIGCGRGLAGRVEAAIDDVAVTVVAVHGDAKLDVIGIRLGLAGNNGLGSAWRSCGGTRRQHGGGQKCSMAGSQPHDSSSSMRRPLTQAALWLDEKKPDDAAQRKKRDQDIFEHN